MARTDVTVQNIAVAGLSPSYDAAHVDGNAFLNDGNTILHVKNGSGGSLTLTVQTNKIVGGVTVQDHQITIGAGTERIIGLFNTGVFNQDDGKVYVDTSTQTSITLMAFKVPKSLS
jgi:hypothetical protein